MNLVKSLTCEMRSSIRIIPVTMTGLKWRDRSLRQCQSCPERERGGH